MLEIFVGVVIFLILVLTGINLAFTLAGAMVLNKIYVTMQSSQVILETIEKERNSVPDYKQEIPLETPTYPLRLR